MSLAESRRASLSADAGCAFFFGKLREMQLMALAARGCSESFPRGLRPPPGLPPPPGATTIFAPPPGLDTPEPVANDLPVIDTLLATKPLQRRDSLGSSCSTAEAWELASLPPSPGNSPRERQRSSGSEFFETGPPQARPPQEPQSVAPEQRQELQGLAPKPSARISLVQTLPSAGPGRVPSVPSVGSAGHYLGLCRACDFTFRGGGCREGAACKFCHLCSPKVCRQRRRERKFCGKAGGRCQQAAAEAPAATGRIV